MNCIAVDENIVANIIPIARQHTAIDSDYLTLIG